MLKKLFLSVLIGFIPVSATAQVTGAGATFPYPIYSKWADAFKKETGTTINYQSIGSGAGIKQIQNKTVTFGATDMPLTTEELEKHGLVQFPLVTGSVVLIHNINQNDVALKIDQISDIYLGNLKKLNNETIVPIRRSDGSGTTYLFTNWLSSESAAFKNKIGTGTSVNWPVGLGAKGNEGVANNVKMTKGGFGYVEYAYAKQNNFKLANIIVNGNVISPNMETFKSGLWPIVSPTYILMPKNSSKTAETKQAIAFFNWVMKHGDRMAEELDYIPLTLEQKKSNINVFESIK